MNQEIVINRILRDLKLFELITEDTNGEFKPYLNAIFVAGWEQGWLDAHQTTAKAIGQYNLEGKLIATYPSLKAACKRTGFSKSGIQHSMKNNVPTRQRWVWKYLVLPELDLSSK
jgi:hypothetical protein